MPRVNGILETAIYADDLHQTAAFYRRVFDFDTLLESERLIALNVSGQNIGIITLSPRESPIESVVKWPGGAQSLYFRDPDDHLVELITPGFWRFS